MIKLLADASLPILDACFPAPFTITRYFNTQEIPALLPGQDILLCRSTLRINSTLLEGHSLSYIATASSGIDHVDQVYLQQQAIQLLHAKGSNASSVADYVMACLAWLKLKHGLNPSTAAIIGYGATGSEVLQRLQTIGLEVIAYDPLKSDFISCNWQQIFDCELVCVHANLHDSQPYPSRNLLHTDFFNRVKANTILINCSRGGIVDEQALLNLSKPLVYCTDVYQHEPNIDSNIVKLASLCTPHIAGHSIEAKQDAVKMLSQQLHAAYQLTLPASVNFALKSSNLNLSEDWAEKILNLYDPSIESQMLKAKPDRATFIELRKAHRRHNL